MGQSLIHACHHGRRAWKLLVDMIFPFHTFLVLSGQSTLRLLHTMVLHEGDLMERKRITKGELAILRLVAGQTLLKLATEKIYEHLIDHVSRVVTTSAFCVTDHGEHAVLSNR